jgi:hypothetical protein
MHKEDELITKIVEESRRFHNGRILQAMIVNKILNRSNRQVMERCANFFKKISLKNLSQKKSFNWLRRK